MPELPEVETVVRELESAGIEGGVITGCSLPWPRTAADITPASLARELEGRTVERARRRGKFIVLEFKESGALLIHLRMTGKLRFSSDPDDLLPHDRALIYFADGRTLILNDTRKFARIRLVESACMALATLGPEPLESGFTPQVLAAALQRSRRAIKTLLLDQKVVAGIGNIYADEALFDAGIHPERPAVSLSRIEVGKLHKSIKKVLRQGIAANGTTLGNSQANFYSVAGRRGSNSSNLRVFRRHGLPCTTCQHEVERIVVGGRGTHFCHNCQR